MTATVPVKIPFMSMSAAQSRELALILIAWAKIQDEIEGRL